MEDLACSEAVHPGFRLWLSSMPSPAFPPSVLQAGLKLAVQPPRGIRATLARAYAAMTDDAFEASPSSMPGAWKHLLLGISFFHATVQVRRRACAPEPCLQGVVKITASACVRLHWLGAGCSAPACCACQRHSGTC